MTDLLGGHGWQHDERAYFGDEPEPYGAPMPPREHTGRRGTIEQLRQWRINEGKCARASCSGELDDQGCCGFCGWSETEERMRQKLARKERRPEDQDEYLETLPGALMLGIEEKK